MKERLATRTVLLDREGRVAILKVDKFDYYKIPGGGVEEDEDILVAARREVLEEAGCECKIVEQLGEMVTDIPDWGMRDVSRGFVAQVMGEKSVPNFDDFERERGFSLAWVESLKTAIELLAKHEPRDTSARQLQERDLEFLKRASVALSS